MAKLSNAKSQFALDVAEQLAVVGKSVLVTHKLKPQIIKQIITRPDLCASFGVFVSNAKQYTKGAKALKASKDFRILGYVGYQNFVKKATLDVSKFQSKVTGDFDLANNALVLVFQKDEATGDFEGDIQDLKSVAITWEKAILPETKIPNAIYLVVLFGQNWIRPKSEKFAAVKLKVNLRKENKRTPAKIKAELKRKANKKLKRINSQLSGLKAASRQTAQRLQAYDKYGEVSRQQFLNSRALVKQFGQRLQNPAQDVTQQDLKRFKSIARKNSKIAAGYKTASGVSNPQALRQRAASLEARINQLLRRRQAINSKLNADLAALDGQQLQVTDIPQQVAQQILVPQLPVQQVANPRVQKLMKRAQILNQRIANAESSKVRGNANFELRKINKQLQALGVPSQVVNTQVVTPQLQVSPQLTAAGKNLEARIAKILGRNQVLKQRIVNGDTKARGNAAFQLRKNAGKLRQLGHQVAPQSIDGTGFNTLGQRIRQILGNQNVQAAVAPQVIQQVVPVQQVPVKKTRGRKKAAANLNLDINDRVDELLSII